MGTFCSGMLGIFQGVLVGLKLFNLANLSWWQVFVPLYIEMGLLLIVIIGMIIED